MKRAKPWVGDRIGRHLQLDHDVILNAIPGRKLSRLKPLVLGSFAKIRSGSVLYAASTIGHHFETGHHVVVREESRIGHHVSIWNNTTLDYGCTVGNRVKIHCNCYVAQYSILEDDVFLAPGVTLANDLFPGSRGAARVLQGPILRRGAQIGVNATILPGVVIGRGALVGAGSVVTRDVPDGGVALGNPARVPKSRTDLHWPQSYQLRRHVAKRYYQNRLRGRRVYEKSS